MKQQFQVGKRTMRLGLCATVLGAALASQSAHAVVIVVDFSANALSTIPFNIDGLYVNMVTGATGLTGATTPGYDINPYFTGTTTPPPVFRILMPAVTGGIVGAAGVATPLALGTVVGVASTFATGIVNATQATAGTRYFGIRLQNEATGALNYGYAVFSQSAATPTVGTVRLMGYAYENTGLNITVAAIPEPSTALLMVGGLLAAGAFRLRQQAVSRNQA